MCMALSLFSCGRIRTHATLLTLPFSSWGEAVRPHRRARRRGIPGFRRALFQILWSLALLQCSISLLLQFLAYGLQALEQTQDHLDSCQVDSQIALQAAGPPQLYDLFLA